MRKIKMKKALLIASVFASLALVPQLSIADYDASPGAVVLAQSDVDPGVIVAATPAQPVSYAYASTIDTADSDSGGTAPAGCDGCHSFTVAYDIDYSVPGLATAAITGAGILDHRISRQNEAITGAGILDHRISRQNE